MSGEHSPQHELPFGWHLHEFHNDAGISSSLEPSGPPLLSHNETNLLDQFFHDPNDLHSDLFSKDFSGSAEWAYPPGYEWNNADLPITEPQSNGGHVSAVASSAEYLRATANQQATNQRNLIPASQEVYAAAASLIPNGRSAQSSAPMDALNYSIPAGSQGNPPFQVNGPSNTQQLQAAQYQLTGSASYDDANHPYVPPAAEPWRGNPRRAPPVRFGSDNNFRASSYAAEAGPTRQVSDTFVAKLELSDGPNSYRTTKSSSSSASRSKRRKISDDSKDHAGQSDAEGSSGDEQESSEMNRRSKKIDKDQDEYRGTPSRKNIKIGKSSNKQASAGKTPRGKNASKRHTPPSSESKPTRENLSEKQKRENHIMSEQKRRNLIKQGYESLEKLVPELRQGGLSKSQILEETAAYMEKLRNDNDELRELLDNG